MIERDDTDTVEETEAELLRRILSALDKLAQRPEPKITVKPPEINVLPPAVNVKPEVRVTVPPIKVPTIEVKAPPVTVNVPEPKTARKWQFDIVSRDIRGRILRVVATAL